MRLLVIMALLAILRLEPAYASETSQARDALEEARLMLRNYDRQRGHQLLWLVFLRSEEIDATKLEIAEAAEMLVDYGGHKSASERKYLLTFASEAGYPPAMVRLSTSILSDYGNAEDDLDLPLRLSEYPKRFSRSDAMVLLRAAAEQNDPAALRLLARNYRSGREGLIQDAFYADELEAKALELLIEEGRSGDHHKLIDAAKQIIQGKGKFEAAEALIVEAVEIGEAQVGGLDTSATVDLIDYYSNMPSRYSAETSADEFRWRKYLLLRGKGLGTGKDLVGLAEFLAGRKPFQMGDENPLDIVAAHAVYNLLNSKNSTAPFRSTLENMAREMSETELQEAVSMARECSEEGLRVCLEQVENRLMATLSEQS